MICTFYSYKGGVGRSMTLASIAELMYRKGLKVLMVDFDLEAPGLERYFDVSDARETEEKRGVIDMLLSYKKQRSLTVQGTPDESYLSKYHVEPLTHFIAPIYDADADKGRLYLIPAGRRNGSEFRKYAERIHDFDWNDFYENWDGELFFDWFRFEAERFADIVLIDSRTGVTEMSGVCTYQLADVVVMFVSPNSQNLDGTLMMAQSLSNKELIYKGRKGRPLSLMFVPSRVDTFEADRLDRFAREFNEKFEEYISAKIKIKKNLFTDFKIPYVPYYSYGEELAVREPDRESAADFIDSMDKIAIAIASHAPTDSNVYSQLSGSGEPLAEPDPVPSATFFVDREDNFRKVNAFIKDDICRLIIIQGFPGIGKTCFGARIVKEFSGQFENILWIACTDKNLFPDVLFSVLHNFLLKNQDISLKGVWNKPDTDLRANRLINALNAKQYLIIFDAFENWLDESSQLKDEEIEIILEKVLNASHAGKFIFISRRRPRTDFLPPGAYEEHQLLGLNKEFGIEFLRKSGFESENEELLGRIVSHCDGNPKMMQIFRSLVKSDYYDPDDLIESDETGEKFFDLILQDATEGLSEESMEGLKQLSILRHPVKRNQFQLLGLDFEKAILPLIHSFLVDKDEQGGFGVSKIVRKYAEGNLSESDEKKLHEKAALLYKKQDDRIPETFEEAQTALEESYHRSQYEDCDKVSATVLSVANLFVDWGYIHQAEHETGKILEIAQNDNVKAECSWILGNVEDLRSDYQKALRHFERAHALYKLLQDHAGIARTLFRMGRISNAQHHFDKADEYFQQCITICKEHRIKVRESWAASLLSMGWNMQERSFDAEEVSEKYNQSIHIASESQDFETLSNAHRSIGFLLWTKCSQKDEARKHYDEAERISTENKLGKELGAIYTDLGYLYNKNKKYGIAQDYINKAIRLFENIGNLHGLASAYCNHGMILENNEDFREAEHRYEQSRSISAEINNLGAQAYVCLRLGNLYRRQNKLVEAKSVLVEAEALCQHFDMGETCSEVKEQLHQISNDK